LSPFVVPPLGGRITASKPPRKSSNRPFAPACRRSCATGCTQPVPPIFNATCFPPRALFSHPFSFPIPLNSFAPYRLRVSSILPLVNTPPLILSERFFPPQPSRHRESCSCSLFSSLPVSSSSAPSASSAVDLVCHTPKPRLHPRHPLRRIMHVSRVHIPVRLR